MKLYNICDNTPLDNICVHVLFDDTPCM